MPVNPFAALADPVDQPANPFAALADPPATVSPDNPFVAISDDPGFFGGLGRTVRRSFETYRRGAALTEASRAIGVLDPETEVRERKNLYRSQYPRTQGEAPDAYEVRLDAMARRDVEARQAQRGQAGQAGQFQVETAQEQEAARVLPEALSSAAQAAVRQQAIPEAPVMRELEVARQGGTWEYLKAIATNPEAFANVAASGLVSSIEPIAASVAMGVLGPGGAATGAMIGTARQETASAILDLLAQGGVDPTNEQAIQVALQDPAFMGEVRKVAGARSVAIGALNVPSAGLAGQMIGAARRAGRSVLPAVAGEMAIQTGLEAGGELGAQVASGQPIDLTQVIDEAVGGLGLSSVETIRGAIPVLAQARQQTVQIAEAAGRVIEQAGQQVADAQQSIQATVAESAEATSQVLENPNVDSLNDLGARQREISDQSKATLQQSKEATQQLQQGTAALQEASTVEAQANMELAEHELLAEQILSQPGALPGGTQESATIGVPGAEQGTVDRAPVLREAVGPVPMLPDLPEVSPEDPRAAGELLPALSSPTEAPISQTLPGQGSGALQPSTATGPVLPGLPAQARGVLSESISEPVQPERFWMEQQVPESGPIEIRPVQSERGQELWAFRAGQPVGMVRYSVESGQIVPDVVQVNQNVRRQGIASELYRAMKAANPGLPVAPGARQTEEGSAFRGAFDQGVAPADQQIRTAQAQSPVESPKAQVAAQMPGADPDAVDAASMESIDTQIDQEVAEAVRAMPSDDPTERSIRTKVLGQTAFVQGRIQLTPEAIQRSRQAAQRAFDEAGLPVRFDPERGFFVLTDPTTEQEVAGRKLLGILNRELGRHRDPNGEWVHVLINSVRSRDDGMWTAPAFSKSLGLELFSVAQGEASFYGVMLAALRAGKQSLTWVAKNVDTVLYKAYSDAFGGEKMTPIQNKIADEIEKQTGVNPRDKKAVAQNRKKVEKATKTALEKVLAELRPRDRKPLIGKHRGKSLWERIVTAANAGVFDNEGIVQDVARAHGWHVPNKQEAARFKKLAEQEQLLRMTPDKEAVNSARIHDIRREMQRIWSTFSKPITAKSWEGIHNTAQAAGEFVSANLLNKLGFFVKQPIDVSTQFLVHVPTRAMAAADERFAAHGNRTVYWQDVGRSMLEAGANLRQGLRPAIDRLVEGLRGKGQMRNVEGIIGSIAAFDRMHAWAREKLASPRPQDNVAGAVAMIASWTDFSFKVARALDNVQATLIEGQEMREMIVSSLYMDQGMPIPEAHVRADEIMGDYSAEMNLALSRAKEILDEQGDRYSARDLRISGLALFRARQYERMRAASLPADDFKRQIETVVQTNGWNLPERSGPGGIVAAPIRAVGQRLPFLAIGKFANPIAIGTNRALTFAGGGFTPRMFGKTDPQSGLHENYWFRTPKDRAQRKREAAIGATIAPVLIGLAMAGVMRVWNKGPDDPEDRELWQRKGYRAGTTTFSDGEGNEFSLSTSTGPLSYLRVPLSAIGMVQDVWEGRAKKVEKEAKEAADRGVAYNGKAELGAKDIGYAAMFGAMQSLTGGRTAGGAVGSIMPDDPRRLEQWFERAWTSQTSALIPYLPAYQEAMRATGNFTEYRTAAPWDVLVPIPGSDTIKRNFLNDPMTDKRAHLIMQTLTGGSSLLPIKDQQDLKPYRILDRIAYRPDSISMTQNFDVGGEWRTLTKEEWTKAMRKRGDVLKAELEFINEFNSDEDIEVMVRDAAQDAREDALDSVGVVQ